MSASNVIDLHGLVHDKIYNSAQAVLHRPENGDANENYEFIIGVTRRFEEFIHPLASSSLTRIASRRAVMVEIPDDLLDDIKKLPHTLRALTTEELGRVDLGHIEGEDRERVRELQEQFNPGALNNRHNRRITTVTESTAWQKKIDRIIELARARPEPVKQLESLADLAAEIIDCAAARLDHGADPHDQIGLRATAVKQSIFDLCRMKPYSVTPKFIKNCQEQIDNMLGLATSGVALITLEGGDEQAAKSNFHLAAQRCEQFKGVLSALSKSIGPNLSGA